MDSRAAEDVSVGIYSSAVCSFDELQTTPFSAIRIYETISSKSWPLIGNPYRAALVWLIKRISSNEVFAFSIAGVTMREKKGGALQKLKKRLSHSFGRLSKYWITYSYRNHHLLAGMKCSVRGV